MAQTGTGDPFSITVGSKDRLTYSRSGQIIGENIVYQHIDILENISSMNPFLVIGGGRGDGEIISLVSVPLRIDPIQRKGHDNENIGVYGGFRPCGVDLTGGYVFDIVSIAYVIVLGCRIGRDPVMDDDIFRDDYPTEYDFTAFVHRLDFFFRDFGWIFTEECVHGNKDVFFRSVFLERSHTDGLNCRDIWQNFCAGNENRFIARGSYFDVVFGIGLYQLFRLQTILQIGSRKFDRGCLSIFVGGKSHKRLLRITGIGNGNRRIFNGNHTYIGNNRNPKFTFGRCSIRLLLGFQNKSVGHKKTSAFFVIICRGLLYVTINIRSPHCRAA